MGSDGEVGREGNVCLSGKQVGDGVIIFGAEEVPDDQGEREIVFGMKSRKLGEGWLQFAIDVTNDEAE